MKRSCTATLAVVVLSSFLVVGCAESPTSPPGSVQAAFGKGGKPGGGGGGEPGDGGSGDATAVLIFRDAAGDGLASDGASYVDGASGLTVSLGTGFVVDFGRKSSRSVTMDFGQELQGGAIGVPAFLGDGSETPASIEIYRDDGAGNNASLTGMSVGDVSDARMSIYFDDPNDRKAEWILSMAQKQAQPFWFGTVECLQSGEGSCEAWRFGPGTDDRLRLLKNLNTSAGEYTMPFEGVFCVGAEEVCRDAAGY